MEVLRCHANNHTARYRVMRLSRHLQSPERRHSSVWSDVLKPAYQHQKLAQRLSDDTITAILAKYEAGATTREVGERFGLAHSSVNKLLKQQGVTARRRSPSPEEVEQAVELYGAGLSTRVIAQHLGFGASTILRALHTAGVTIRPRFGS